MDNLRNSLVLLQPTGADAKLFGWYVLGGNVVIETIAQYLARVPVKHRSPDAPVTMQLPKSGYTSLGTYTVAEFKGGILANFEGHYYTFVGGLADENFVEIPGAHSPVTIAPESKNSATIGNDQVLHIKKKDVLSYLEYGTVTWLHDLVFLVSECGYYIQGVYYTSPAVEITLSAADATNPRIDLFFVDVNSVAAVLEGTPAEMPMAENLDPYTQLEIREVTVTAGATEPPEIEEEVIYNENVEWLAELIATKDGATVDFDNAVAPFTGAKQTRATFLPYKFGGIIFDYTKDVDVNISNSNLILSVRTSRVFTESESIYLKLLDGFTAKSQPVYIKDGQYGFNSSLTTYQTLTIPFADFKATTNLINTLRISFTGWGAGVAGNTTVDFDLIKIQKGIAPVENTEIDPVFLEWLAKYVPPTGFDLSFVDTEDIVWDVDLVAKTIKANTVGFTGTFLDQGGNTITVLRGLIKDPTPLIVDELLLTWDNIANVPVADASSVTLWNTLFDLPTNGVAFTSVVVTGNVVNLIGGSGITLKTSLFENNINLLNIEDIAGCITSLLDTCFNNCGELELAALPAATNAGVICFGFCTKLNSVSMINLSDLGEGGFISCEALTSISLPSLLASKQQCFDSCLNLSDVSLPLATLVDGDSFSSCMALNTVYIPSCINLGGDTGLTGVFGNITGNVITLTIPASLMTCNVGNPDGDIQYLMDNNTVTIITV